MKELLEKTDETHPLSITELILMLSENGISAERKSIYHDIEVLREFGIDIENRREKPAGYYVASRDFELPELKLLVDAVQCARFITKKKSKELIRKLEGLTSKSEALQLQRQVFVKTGECMTIMQGLRNTHNLMQLLSQQYTFMDMIEEENGGYHVDEITYDNLLPQ